MRPSSPLRLAALSAAVTLAACSGGGDPSGPDNNKPVVTQRLDIVAFSGVVPGLSGKTLALAPSDSARFTAVVNASNGTSSPASNLSWTTSDAAIASVDATGWIRAKGLGTARVIASASQYADTLSVTVSRCGSTPAALLAVGQVQHFGSAAALCVVGSASDEYALVAVNTDQDSTRTTNDVRTTIAVSSSGLSSPGPATDRLGDGVATLSRSVIDPFGTAGSPARDEAFEVALRERAQAELRPKMNAARATFAATRPRGLSLSVSAAVPTVGQLVSLNTSLVTCDTTKAGGIARRTGRVVAVSSKAIVVADTANPAGGFTDSDYQYYAAAFDTLAYPLDVATFGSEKDIDGNGRSIIFFTSAVNAMTPRNASYYVGGFFFERDLFQNTAPKSADYCAGSNAAEMFYMLVPDPTGTINGNRFRKGFVDSVTVGTLAHEFQHLINASRRLYVNDAPNWEDTWLNEGLSHVAEELAFFKAAGGLAPRATKLDGPTITASPVIKSMFNYYLTAGNIQRLTTFLVAPETNSPYSNNDELETRAATWQFLRYAVDRLNGSDVAVWQKLVATTKLNGMPNLVAALGVSNAQIGDWFRDWAVANYADGLAAGLDPVYTYRSWNFRSIYAGLKSSSGQQVYKVFPLATRALADATPQTVALRGGAAAYLRFSVGANNLGRITTSAPGGAAIPSNIGLSIVRVK